MPPRLLVIDDLFGRNTTGGRNADRENLCAHFLWKDITGDAATRGSRQNVLKPTAEVVFSRGQTPEVADVGALVMNDLDGSLAKVREGWSGALSKGTLPWAMVLLDLCFYTGKVTEASNRRAAGMPEGRARDDDPSTYFGLTLLDAIHRESPELPVFILSSKPREEVSLEFSRRGALGFIARDDLNGPELLEQALQQHGLLPDPAGDVVGNSLPLLLALREGRRAARHRQNVLIRGERGSGKELLARYIHRMTLMAKEGASPFVTVNSAVLTTEMFASELFGIEPRTATAVEGKIGLIEAADAGDLFLDEIGDMPPDVQAAMLRVLQERQITRVGARKAKSIDVRFMSATNVDLEGARAFRADLLDRLRLGGTLWLPGLRERKSDLPALAESLIRKAERDVGGARAREITPDAMALLRSHDWPGNVRELSACLFDAVNRNPDVEYLVPGHLRIGISAESPRRAAPTEQQPRADMLPAASINTFVEAQNAVRFDQQNKAQWVGRLEDMQRSHARLLARYLNAALEAKKDPTAERPDGELNFTGAVKLITGDDRIKSATAADIIKRLLRPLEGELEGDLLKAWQWASDLRSGSPKASKPGR